MNAEVFCLKSQSQLPSVFPAVAIMDRMIMMPHGVGDAIERSRVFPWFLKPVDVGGVVLTDYRTRDSIEEAVQQAASELKFDLRKLCRRHMVARRIKLSDFHELSRLLNVEIEYLRMHEADLLGPAAELRPGRKWRRPNRYGKSGCTGD